MNVCIKRSSLVVKSLKILFISRISLLVNMLTGNLSNVVFILTNRSSLLLSQEEALYLRSLLLFIIQFYFLIINMVLLTKRLQGFSAFTPKPPKKIIINLPMNVIRKEPSYSTIINESNFNSNRMKRNINRYVLSRSLSSAILKKKVSDDIKICPKSCKQSALSNYKRLKYLNEGEINNMTSSTLDIGFLKSNPSVFLGIKSKKDLKVSKSSSNFYVRKQTKKLTKGKTFSVEHKENNEIASTDKMNIKHSLSIVNKINTIQHNKIFLANINKTKQEKLAHLIEGPSSQRSDSSTSTSKGFCVKRCSMMDRFLLKLIDPDECLEDYVIENDKPFDKFSKFKRQCAKEKRRVDGLIDDLNKAVSMNEKLLKVYTTRLKSKNKYVKEKILIEKVMRSKEKKDSN